MTLLKNLVGFFLLGVSTPAFPRENDIKSPGNLIRNGNFERAGDGVPANWSADCPAGIITKSTTDSKWDSNSLLLIDSKAHEPCQAYSSRFPIESGKTYKVEGQAKWDAVGNSAPLISIRFFDTSGKVIHTSRRTFLGPPGTYNQVTLISVAPIGAVSGQVVLHSETSKTLKANFDGIATYEISAIANEVVYHAGPTATGDGSGVNASNLFRYNDQRFWASNVRKALLASPVRIVFQRGNYHIAKNNANLRIIQLGDSRNTLVIEGENAFGTVIQAIKNPESSPLSSMVIDRSYNIIIRNLHFRSGSNSNVYYFLKIDNSKNITVAGVSALDADGIKYGVFGPSSSTGVTFSENEIQRIGSTAGQHAIYGIKMSGLKISNSVFEDITGSNIRCRNRCQTISVTNSEFLATGEDWRADRPSRWPFFIELAVYNDQIWNGSNKDQQEWFLGGIEAVGNTFTYSGVGKGTRNVPFHIGATGYKPWDGSAFREYLITKPQARQILEGNCARTNDLLKSKFGLDLSKQFSLLRNSFSGQRRLLQLRSYVGYGARTHYLKSEYEGGEQNFDLSSCLTFARQKAAIKPSKIELFPLASSVALPKVPTTISE